MNIVVAGEYGALRIRIYAASDDVRIGGKLTKKRVDKFRIEFSPWRSCTNVRGADIPIAEGVLDYDDHKFDSTMIRLGEDVFEAFQLVRAKELMTRKD